MRVSVVIPAYNEENYIGQCLESLIMQEEPADEIIIVNNNSTDRTEKVVIKYKATLLNVKEKGVIYARNKGFDSAQFDIIARTDADSKVPLDWIKKIKNNFSTLNIDALSGPISYYDMPLKSPHFSRLFYSAAQQLFHYPILIGPNMALSKKIWQKVRTEVCMDPQIVHEDIDVGIHVANVGGKIYNDSTLVVQSSGRRIMTQPQSFFIEYTQRLIKMKQSHHVYT